MIRAGARRRAGRRIGLAGLALLAAAVGAGAWYVSGGSGWRARAVFEDGSGPSAPLAFSPDGGTLATIGPGGIALWDVAKGRRQADWKVVDGRLQGGPPEVVEATYTPDGQDLVVLYREPGRGPKVVIDRVEPASGVVRSTVETGLEVAGTGLYAFNADGRRFRLILREAAPGGFRSVDCDVQSGEILAVRPISAPGASTLLSVSPDSRFLALGPPGRADVILWGIDGDREVSLLPGEGAAPIRSGAFSGDGRSLAIGRSDGSIELWDVTKGSRRDAFRPHSPGFSSTMLRFAPGGSALASSGDRAGLAGPDSESIVIDPADGWFFGRVADEGRPAIGPDGDVLATASRKDGAVRLRKLVGKPEKPAPLGKRQNPWLL